VQSYFQLEKGAHFVFAPSFPLLLLLLLPRVVLLSCSP